MVKRTVATIVWGSVKAPRLDGHALELCRWIESPAALTLAAAEFKVLVAFELMDSCDSVSSFVEEDHSLGHGMATSIDPVHGEQLVCAARLVPRFTKAEVGVCLIHRTNTVEL